ncbi:MAG: YkgJ family cysteine cluster protein [Saprospiraceae bacterium]|nr:YkgJ family cysteine cluster protein [Saprospiraceae bacterium]
MKPENLNRWENLTKADYKNYLAFFKKLSAAPKSQPPDIETIHSEVFSNTDCLSCANCCKTSPALLTKEDITRISKHLQISTKEFQKKYVLEDVNGELSLNNVPCQFLLQDNSCSIYEIRPEACRQFPHTHDKDYPRRVILNTKNIFVCPAALAIAEKWENVINNLILSKK